LQFGIWLKIFLFGGFSTFYLQNVGGFWWGAASRSSNCCNIVNLLEKPRKYAKKFVLMVGKKDEYFCF